MTVQKNISTADLSAMERDFDEASPSSGFSIVDFLQIIRVRRQIIIGTAVAVVTLAMVVVSHLTPLYTASAVVMLDQRKNNVEDVSAVLSGLPTDQASVQNQVQILTSRALAGRVIDKLKLDEDPEFDPKKQGWGSVLQYVNPLVWIAALTSTKAPDQQEDRERAAVVDKFLSRIAVAPIGLSTALKVSFSSEDANKSARITNAIANAYVEDQLEAKFTATQKATEWLSNRIKDLSKQAEAAEAAVQRYKAEHNITDTGNGSSVVDQQVLNINAQLVQAKTDLAQKQAIYGRVAALARAGRAADLPEVMSSPLIAQLRAQESEIMRQEAEFASKYGDRHPKMLDLRSQKANMEAKINEEVRRVVEGVASQVAVAQANVSSLQQTLTQMEGNSASQNEDKVQLTALQSAATSARSMYEAFMGRLNETQGQQGIQTPDARIISLAEVPTGPSFPKKGLTLALAIPGGLLLGLFFAFMIERLDSGFRTGAQVEQTIGLPVLATIPELEAPRKGVEINASDRVVDKPMSSFAESIRGLQLGLTLSNVDKQPQVIVVTSSVPGEGKTTVAISLARQAAVAGQRVVVLDGDLRRPMIAKTLNLNSTTGIIESLTGIATLDQCFSKDDKTDLLILPCLHTPANPADLLGSKAMQNLIANLRKAFDLIIIDSAPILPVNDTKILSRLTDAVLFVVRWEKTPRDAAAHAVQALRDVHAPISGIALTRADTDRFHYYSYGYQSYSNYNKYYNN